MITRYKPESGFVARSGGPDRKRPHDWIVWHFTHADNLPGIITAGRLLADSAVTPTTEVAYNPVKELRRHKVVAPDSRYPASMASDHVPFYIAARSPMLYVVCKGHSGYSGGAGPLVHLGVALGDIIDADLTWCASDGNAAASYTKFSRQVDTLGPSSTLTCSASGNGTTPMTTPTARAAAPPRSWYTAMSRSSWSATCVAITPRR
ncbi:Hypothetical protein ERS031505_01273 [Mycobacterium tuberculosis]|nr:Hypothetical protein ERS031505_01273 [Mycobacterium tuberculosis]